VVLDGEEKPSTDEPGQSRGPDVLPEKVPGPPAGQASRSAAEKRAPRGEKPDLVESHEPLYREAGGFRLRLDPADLARLRELPGSKGKTDRELGEEFFDAQAARLAASLAPDVEAPAEVRVVVDPYSRQAFVAVQNKIRGIVSF
jgi:hypothetical protein